MPAEIVDETGAEPGREPATTALGTSAAAVMDVLLDVLGLARSEVVVLLVGDARMRELNLQWRGKNRPTDVLSFSQREGEGTVTVDSTIDGTVEAGGDLLGDIVISVDTLQEQARAGGWSDDEELSRLLLHGLLHLLGYDHELEADEIVMKREEGRLVRALEERGFRCAWEGEAR